MITNTPKAIGPWLRLHRVGRNTAPYAGQPVVLGQDTGKCDEQIILANPLSELQTDGLSNFRARPIHSVLSTFNSLPNATTIAAAKDPDFVYIGTGTVVIARATNGGINVKTQASTPANNDSAIITTVANDASIVPLIASAQPRLSTRVNLTQAVKQLFSATLDQTFTAVDPTASAGDGAGFIFDPTGAIILGTNNGGNLPALLAASEPNWIAFQKINGVNIFVDTGIAVVAGTSYDLDVVYDQNLVPTFMIGGQVVGGPAVTGSPFAAGTSGITMAPLIGIQVKDGGTPTQHDFDLRYISVERFVA